MRLRGNSPVGRTMDDRWSHISEWRGIDNQYSVSWCKVSHIWYTCNDKETSGPDLRNTRNWSGRKFSSLNSVLIFIGNWYMEFVLNFTENWQREIFSFCSQYQFLDTHQRTLQPQGQQTSAQGRHSWCFLDHAARTQSYRWTHSLCHTWAWERHSRLG